MPGPPLADTLKRRCAPPHGPVRKSAREEGSGSRSCGGGRESLRGVKTMRVSAAVGFRPARRLGFPGRANLCSRAGRARARSGNGKRGTASREVRRSGKIKTLKVRGIPRALPGAINPGGFGGRKPARACETPRPERGGCLAGPAPYVSPELQALKGNESPGGLSASGGRTGAAKVASVVRRADGRPPAQGPEGAREPMRGAAGGSARTPCKRCNTHAARRGQEDRGAVETACRERRSR